MAFYPGIIWTLFFLLEIIILAFLSKIVQKNLGVWAFKLTGSYKRAVFLLSIIYFPGTLIHELAHALFAGVMFVHVGSISLVPEISQYSIKLGSVEVGKTDPFRRAIIGVAPVFLGISLLLVASYFLTADLAKSASLPYSLWLLIFYFVFVISNTMFSSPKDLEGTFEVAVFIICIFLALYILGYYQIFEFLGNLLFNQGLNYIMTAAKLLFFPILVDLLLLGLLKILKSKNNNPL